MMSLSLRRLQRLTQKSQSPGSARYTIVLTATECSCLRRLTPTISETFMEEKGEVFCSNFRGTKSMEMILNKNLTRKLINQIMMN